MLKLCFFGNMANKSKIHFLSLEDVFFLLAGNCGPVLARQFSDSDAIFLLISLESAGMADALPMRGTGNAWFTMGLPLDPSSRARLTCSKTSNEVSLCFGVNVPVRNDPIVIKICELC